MQRNRGSVAALGTVLGVLLLCLAAAHGATAATATVSPGESIQAAIDAAVSGDTIIVSDGTFTETITIDKSLTLRSANGAAACTLVAAVPTDHALVIAAPSVTVTGFTVTGVSSDVKAAIFVLDGADGAVITQNRMDDNGIGIFILSSDAGTVSENVITTADVGVMIGRSGSATVTDNTLTNTTYGIYLEESDNATISNNVIEMTPVAALTLAETVDSTVSENHIAANRVGRGEIPASGIYGNGIDIREACSGNIIANNMLSNSYRGILIGDSHTITVRDNTLSNNTLALDFDGSVEHCVVADNTISDNGYAAKLTEAYNNTIEGNTIQGNTGGGIAAYFSTDNVVTGNTIQDNGDYGLLIVESADNRIYNNFFNNPVNAEVTGGGANVWHTEKTAGANIIGGAYIAGNFWSDYTGEDTTGDGIGETAYTIGTDQDAYPLTEAHSGPATDPDRGIPGIGAAMLVVLIAAAAVMMRRQ